jgi:hypothetical protein
VDLHELGFGGLGEGGENYEVYRSEPPFAITAGRENITIDQGYWSQRHNPG